MKIIFVTLIALYQRYISPYKGFHCAHHALHGQQTCSNAVKDLVLKYGFSKSLPLIKQRFNDCRLAYDCLQKELIQSHTADIPCGAPCDVGIGDCGGTSPDSSACNIISFCDWPFNSRHYSNRTKQLLLIAFLLVVLILSYIFYGRQIAEVYLIDLGQSEQNLVTRLIQRDQPDVRVLVMADGKKHYSNIAKLKVSGVETKFVLQKPLPTFEFDYLEVLDARLNVANELIVVGQVLEKFESSQTSQQGQRFAYRLKRRWHF